MPEQASHAHNDGYWDPADALQKSIEEIAAQMDEERGRNVRNRASFFALEHGGQFERPMLLLINVSHHNVLKPSDRFENIQFQACLTITCFFRKVYVHTVVLKFVYWFVPL